MRTNRAAALLLAASGAVGCSAAAPRAGGPSGAVSRAPYDSPAVAKAAVSIRLDLEPAKQILAFLARERFDEPAAKALEEVPAVADAVRDSRRPASVFERDLEAAFDEQARVTIFDFRKIREDRAGWGALIAMIESRSAELIRLAASRAVSLLPPDATVAVAVEFELTFGLPGREDHLILIDPDTSARRVLLDLSRALSEIHASPAPEQFQHLSRLIAGEAYQPAWAAYRAASPAWHRRDPAFGPLEPLLRSAAEVGPGALYAVDENFFPLSEWLKEPMKSSIDEFNRVAERIVSAEGDLDQRVAVAAEVRKPEFASRVAGPAGGFFADGIIQTLGLDAYRRTLTGGPRAFFEAYDRAATEKKRELIPLAKVIRDRLAAKPLPR